MKDFLRKPWVAAVLNFCLPGLGYIASGKRKTFSYFILASTILFSIGYYLVYVQYGDPGMMRPSDWWLAAGDVAISSGFAYDAYHEAKK